VPEDPHLHACKTQRKSLKHAMARDPIPFKGIGHIRVDVYSVRGRGKGEGGRPRKGGKRLLVSKVRGAVGGKACLRCEWG
jgi:hypothetical protein